MTHIVSTGTETGWAASSARRASSFLHEIAISGTLVPTDRREAPMTKTVKGKPAQAGDEVQITGHAVGTSPKKGVIEEVLGDPGHERFRVRWEDGHESIFFPGEDAVVRRPPRKRAKSTA
jgi:hypothetical protein